MLRRYLFTAKSLYMFRVSTHLSSGVPKTVTAASGTGHNIGTATSLRCVIFTIKEGFFSVRTQLSSVVIFI